MLNFQITVTLALFAFAFCLMLVPLGLIVMSESGQEPGALVGISSLLLSFPLLGIAVFCTYQGVINPVRSLSDKPTRYPLSIPFLK